MCHTKRKFPSKDCNNMITQEKMLCEDCMDKLGDLIERYPIVSPRFMK